MSLGSGISGPIRDSGRLEGDPPEQLPALLHDTRICSARSNGWPLSAILTYDSSAAVEEKAQQLPWFFMGET